MRCETLAHHAGASHADLLPLTLGHTTGRKAKSCRLKVQRQHSNYHVTEMLESMKDQVPYSRKLNDFWADKVIYNCMFSILLCHDGTSPDGTLGTLRALSCQTYRNFELILLGSQNDALNSVALGPTRGVFCIEEGGHRYSEIMASLRGEFVLFLTAGDIPNTKMLEELNTSIVRSKRVSSVDAIIFDHTLGDSVHVRYLPGWDPDLLEHLNYIGRACCIRLKTLLEHLQPEDGYSLKGVMLRAPSPDVIHIQNVLGHFGGLIPTARPLECSQAHTPPMSIVIPNRNGLNLLTKCVGVLREMTMPFELVIVDNESDDPQIFDFYRSLESEFDVKIIYFNRSFNYSGMINLGVANATHEYILILNNDVIIGSVASISSALNYAIREQVGVVGSILRYPDGSVQHAGMVLRTAPDGTADAEHILRFSDYAEDPFVGALSAPKNWQSVTGAFQLVRKSTFVAAGGYDEVNLPLEHNDVDFCLSVRKLGLRVICLPLQDIVHDESATRGQLPLSKTSSLNRDARNLMSVRWASEFESDPYLNRNLEKPRKARSLGIGNVASIFHSLWQVASLFLKLTNSNSLQDPQQVEEVLCSSRQLQAGVCIVGPLTSANEIGSLTRALGGACDSERLPISYLNTGSIDRGEYSSFRTLSRPRTDRDIALCVSSLRGLSEMLPYLGEGRRRIAFLSCHERIDSGDISLLDTFEEVWTSSEDVADDLRKTTTKSVCLVPQPISGRFVRHQLQIPDTNPVLYPLDLGIKKTHEDNTNASQI